MTSPIVKPQNFHMANYVCVCVCVCVCVLFHFNIQIVAQKP